jgi:hypothetical protein
MESLNWRRRLVGHGVVAMPVMPRIHCQMLSRGAVAPGDRGEVLCERQVPGVAHQFHRPSVDFVPRASRIANGIRRHDSVIAAF